MIAKITRIEQSDNGTFGVLTIDGRVFCLTLELPWVDNKEEISCIPSGIYLCEKTISEKFGVTFEVTGVPERQNILFHAGNLIKDTKGCILLGETYFKFQEGQRGIAFSKTAFHYFIKETSTLDSFELEII